MKTCKNCELKKPLNNFFGPHSYYCNDCFKLIHKPRDKTTKITKGIFEYEAALRARQSACKAYEKTLERLEKKECEWTEIWSMMIWLDDIDYKIKDDRTYSRAQLNEIWS